MTVVDLAMSSVRHRRSAFVATFVTLFLGAVIVMAFAAMIDTAAGDSVDSTTSEALSTMGTVVGGWSLIIVVFAVISTLGLSVRQRGTELALLKSIGLALLAPTLLRKVTGWLRGPLMRSGSGGWLAVQNMEQRTQQMAGALMPVILFTAISTGTLYMQSIENAAAPAPNSSIPADEAQTVETLNFVVVGMIAVFAAIMVINTLVASTTHRRQEFGQQRLAGSTPPQVLRMVSMEGAVLASAGVLFGSVASIVTVIPFSIARTSSVLPDVTIALYGGIVTVAGLLTLVSCVGAARQAMRGPAVEAVAA